MEFGDLQRFIAERLARPLPGAEAQRRFAPRPHHRGWRPDDLPPDARAAAALLLIYPGPAGPTIPLTVRHGDLPHHPGQVSLPGGRINPGETPQAAALREAHEEVGVDPGHVRVLGPLSTLWVIVSNHVIWPFIGVADARPDFQLASREVEALVEVPLEDLHDLTRVRWEQRTREGVAIDVPFFDFGGHPVWGATAMILGEFGALFDPAFGPQGRKRVKG